MGKLILIKEGYIPELKYVLYLNIWFPFPPPPHPQNVKQCQNTYGLEYAVFEIVDVAWLCPNSGYDTPGGPMATALH